jgi:diguanylate cyclase (GGDEF)-like protein
MQELEIPNINNILPLNSDVWEILLVDDDEQVHTVTTLALSSISIEGKKLTFYHAYSSNQAIQLIKDHPHIAVMLLDVVMEEDNSGLELVKIIRDTIKNHTLRIILRTGQPGSAPELDVIQQYDINDYKMKSELTRIRLISTMTTAVRSYIQITQLAYQSAALTLALEFNNNILLSDSIPEFLELVGIFLPKLFPELQTISVYQQVDNGLIYSWHQDSADPSPGYVFSYGKKTSEVRTLTVKEHMALIPLMNPRSSRDESNGNLLIQATNITSFNSIQVQLLELIALQLTTAFQNVSLVKHLEFSAYKDSLTGLLNKAGFLTEVENQLHSNSTFDSFTMVVMDIDEFSKINSSLGHSTGDLLLVFFADRLRQHFSHLVTLGRIASDIFALFGPSNLLIPHLVMHAIEEPFQIDLEQYPLRATMGFQESREKEKPIELLNNASIAMKKAKELVPSRFISFTQEMRETVHQSLGINRQIKPALLNNEFSLYFQPQIDLDSQKVIGCEALLRWIKPDGTIIPPDKFISIAEQSGSINELGKWVILEAASTRATWAKEQFVPSDFFLAINASVKQFFSTSFFPYVEHIVNTYQIKPGQIDLEITESIIMQDTETVIDLIDKLKNLGISISIDDFGTGYSSLSYLLNLPIDRLKIDRTFIQTIHTDNKSSNLTSLVINLGKELGIQVLAEGVEIPAQAKRVKDLGCHAAQGYLYGKPMAEPDFIFWLQTWQNKEQ